jgi:hypothetical protein
LASFREQRDQTERAAIDTSPVNVDVPVEWGIAGKKRKRGTESGPVKGLKLRKPSTTGDNPDSSKTAHVKSEIKQEDEKAEKDSMTTVPTPIPKATGISLNPSGLGLGAYSSDEDDE